MFRAATKRIRFRPSRLHIGPSSIFPLPKFPIQSKFKIFENTQSTKPIFQLCKEIKEDKEIKTDKNLKVLILGLGGRAQYLLVDCLKESENIEVLGVCDDFGKASLASFTEKLEQKDSPLINQYKKIFTHTKFYRDDDKGLQDLFTQHNDADIIVITSANDKHLAHLNSALKHSSCRKFYMEKPLFITLEEFKRFYRNHPNPDANINIGLTLAYSSMAKIVHEKLAEFKNQLGPLKKVKAWERVKFSQALTSFMMNWRRDVRKSGGLLLEKSIHDLHLLLSFLMKGLALDPQEIAIQTTTAHDFYKKSKESLIIDQAVNNSQISKTLINKDHSPFQPVIQFEYKNHKIDWPNTIKSIFSNFPEDAKLNDSHIIPDYHRLSALLTGKTHDPVHIELEVNLGGFRPTTQRGMLFNFEKGTISLDVMASSLIINLHDGKRYQFDIKTNNSDHADGDAIIAQTILKTLPEGYSKATLEDPIVYLANFMGLVSEDQARRHDLQAVNIIKTENNKWELESEIPILKLVAMSMRR